MRDDEIRRLLTTRNPWWRTAATGGDATAWTATHRTLRDRGRYDLGYRSGIFADIAVDPVGDSLVVLTGPRRVGKSVTLFDLAATLCRREDIDPRQIIHLQCDELVARDLRRALTLGRELTRVVDQHAPTRRIWLFDEVSAVTGWTAVLKAARDATDFGDDAVIVTSSRWSAGDDVLGNLLAGRAGSGGRRIRHLFPLTFRDFLAATRPELHRPPTFQPADLQEPGVRVELEGLRFDVDAYDLAWQDYLTCGGFPRAVAEHTRAGAVSMEYVRDLVAWLQRDVDPDSAPQSLPLLLHEIALRMTSPLSIRATAQDLGMGRDATASRLNRLVSSFAALWCPQFTHAAQRVENAQMKMYLTDPLLAQLPARVRAGLPTPDMTALNEAAIAVALAQAIDELEEGRWISGDTVGYVRTGGGKEVDLGPAHVPTPTGTELSVPIESKWVDVGWRSEAQVMEKKYGRGIVATKSILDMDHATWAVPAPLLSLMLR
jgi:predicted AAA+ superfamily ATPase